MTNEEFDRIVGQVPIDSFDGRGERTADEEAVDETTGASPGTAQACSDFGWNSLEANLKEFGIKPPGVA